MSEKTKTPREMAIAILNTKYPAVIAKHIIRWEDNTDFQLVMRGLEAGAKMGWDKGRIAGKLQEWKYHSKDTEIKELSFDEWWAEVNKEGEKSST